MIDYIKGEITELTPANVVVENNGVGYFINIPLTVYTALSQEKSVKLFVYEAIREDAHVLFGFLSQEERHLFLLLISVSGVGANTARVIMSSYSVKEIQDMIAAGNVAALNNIKGIGAKTAQRIIVDLKDKILKIGGISADATSKLSFESNSVREETLAALVMLGYSQVASQKVVDKILKEEPELKVEQVIKAALKML
ncbi:Holliday junction ATP-dependent DNA helicase RuvA [uncultured Paludibacter sp.]|uniref:Holliday junction branch migration complex subunit RuvA n=1 Tax=uncultured Paludibacter sp. TaxID=497635 RepID=A0A653ACA8_9BACT|nr:Holliday junction ATP-dependent DNA helicase RuvA [uncultured Paludibacter sp.]